MALVVIGNWLPANAEDTRDVGLITGLGRCPGEGNGNALEYPVWKIPWTEEPGSYSSWGHRELDVIGRLSTHIV